MRSWPCSLPTVYRIDRLHTGMSRVCAVRQHRPDERRLTPPPLTSPRSAVIFYRQGGSSLRRSRLKLFCSICTTIQRLHRIWDRPQIHGSKLKPDPSGDGGQASVVCITHGVFLLRIRKNPFNGLISLCINPLAQMVFRYQCIQIYNDWLAPRVSSPVFHENAPFLLL